MSAATAAAAAAQLLAQMLAGSVAPAYRRCLGALHQGCLSRLLAFLSLQEQLLTTCVLDLNGAPLLLIDSVDRGGLAA